MMLDISPKYPNSPPFVCLFIHPSVHQAFKRHKRGFFHKSYIAYIATFALKDISSDTARQIFQ